MIWKRNNEEEEEVAMISILSIISGAIFDITRQLHGASQLVKMGWTICPFECSDQDAQLVSKSIPKVIL